MKRQKWNWNQAACRTFATTLVAMAILIALPAPPALALTSISTCPANITAPGNYQLTANLTCSVTITASNVSLVLNSHQIAPPAGSDGIDVNPSDCGGLSTTRLNHVAIEGPGLITGGANGISTCNTDFSQVALVAVRNTAFIGMNSSFDTFLTLGSNVVGNGGGYGIFLFRCISCVVAGNDSSGNNAQGIFLDSTGSSVNVSSNTVEGNKNEGIHVSGGVAARVYANVAAGNTIGIEAESSSAQIFNNTALGNSRDLAELGVFASWSSNVFLTNGGDPNIH